jgi:hypothetical protein
MWYGTTMIVQGMTPREAAVNNIRPSREGETDQRLRVTRTESGVIAAYIHELADHEHRRGGRA